MSTAQPVVGPHTPAQNHQASAPESAGARTVGIDVASTHLDSWSDRVGAFGQFANTDAGVQQLIDHLQPVNPTLVVVEASGGYERRLVAALQAANIKVHVANPKRVRDYAKAVGQEAKSDQLDAQLLAQFGKQLAPPPTEPTRPETRHLHELDARHQQLTEMLTAEKNRLKQAPGHLRQGIQDHIDWLTKTLDALEQQIDQDIQDDPKAQELSQIVQSVPGVGRATAAILIGGLPELGKLSTKKLSALVGVAPFACDSGRYRGKRHIRGGRARVRSILYMAALSASQYAPPIKAYYHRLLQAGKLKKVALTACIRKLLGILNALVKSKTKWAPKCQTA